MTATATEAPIVPSWLKIHVASEPWEVPTVWLREGAPIGLDVETTGLDPFAEGFAIRTVQLATETQAWVLRVTSPQMRETVTQLLLNPSLRFVTHGSFDPVVLRAAWGIDLSGRTIDSHLLSRLVAPGDEEDHGLKALSAKWIGMSELEQAEKALHARFKAEALAMGEKDPERRKEWRLLARSPRKLAGWGFANTDTSGPEFTAYAGMDAACCLRLAPALVKVLGTGRNLVAHEMRLADLAVEMRCRGIQVDVDLATGLAAAAEEHIDNAEQHISEATGCIARSPKLADWLVEEGVVFTEDEQTVTGRPSLAAGHLDAVIERELATRGETRALDVLMARRRMMQHTNDKSNLDQFLSLADRDGRVHPDIRTLRARTARMCLPDDHLLLTKRGLLPIDEVVVGDETIDMNGALVKVLDIHRYSDQEVYVHESKCTKLECTPEHRWLTTSEGGVSAIEPIGARSRQRIILAPQTGGLNFKSRVFDTVRTEGERFAAIVGLLVTDGRCSDSSTPGIGMKACIYQTEKKFYSAICNILPSDAVMYDSLTAQGDRHHEIGLAVRWLRPRLNAAGLFVEKDSTLRYSEDLLPWVIRLPLNEVRAFLQAVWLADGGVTHPVSKVISCSKSEELRKAVRVAAYRCGYSSSVGTQPPSGWGKIPKHSIFLKKAVRTVREFTTTQRRSDVWCVTTETGTFTAWSPDIGPYLTGNSVTYPALQTLKKHGSLRACFLADPGMSLISADFSQVELRVAAALSGDPNLMAPILAGEDLHSDTARRIFGEGFTEEQRAACKTVNFSVLYGGGAKTVAHNSGIPIDEARSMVEKWKSTYPVLAEMARSVGRRSEVVTPTGRIIPTDPRRPYSNLNYLIQSTARDLLVLAVFRLCDQLGLRDRLAFLVHDEVVLQAPKDDAEHVLASVVKVMETVLYGVPITASGEVLGPRWGSL